MQDINRFCQLFKLAYNSSEALSSDEVLSRQINLAIEFQRQQNEMLKEKATTIIDSKDNNSPPLITNMETARLKVNALRRTTMRRQEGDIDFHLILQEKMKQINDSFTELEEELNESSSVNTVVDGFIVKKNESRFKPKLNSTENQTDNVLAVDSDQSVDQDIEDISLRERIKVQEDTRRTIDKIVKNAK